MQCLNFGSSIFFKPETIIRLYTHQAPIFSFIASKFFCNSMFCHQTSKKTKRSGIKPMRNANQMTSRCCFSRSEGCLLRQDVSFSDFVKPNSISLLFQRSYLFQLPPDHGIRAPIFSLKKTCYTNTISHLLENLYQCCWFNGKLRSQMYSEAEITSLLLNQIFTKSGKGNDTIQQLI